MTLAELTQLPLSDGVYLFEKEKNQFEEKYLALRKKEKRLYSDEEVKLLPFASSLNPHKKEWEYRANSFIRFKKYLSRFNNELNILDLGCGNGWFAGELLKDFPHSFYCVDVNLYELKQGARIFKSDKIKFIYGNILDMEIDKNSFDLVVLNSSVQYFPDFNRLMKELLYFLRIDGEIHIMDSMFYQEDKLSEAKKRSEDYFKSIGFEEMKDFYFHHSYKDLINFNPDFLFNPETLKNKLLSFAFRKESPFPWIRIKR